jgi:hypothetical protein
VDRLQYLATFANAYAALVGHVPVPDGLLCVEADAIGGAVLEVGPQPTVREAAVSRDVEAVSLLP